MSINKIMSKIMLAFIICFVLAIFLGIPILLFSIHPVLGIISIFIIFGLKA